MFQRQMQYRNCNFDGGKNMIKCEYCGKKIGLLSVRYTWIEKDKRAIHDSCLERQKLEKEFQEDEKLMDDLKKITKNVEKKFKEHIRMGKKE